MLLNSVSKILHHNSRKQIWSSSQFHFHILSSEIGYGNETGINGISGSNDATSSKAHKYPPVSFPPEVPAVH